MSKLESACLSTDLAVNLNANLSRLKEKRRLSERSNVNEERHQRVEARKRKEEQRRLYQYFLFFFLCLKIIKQFVFQ